jgi:hypothetical protein
MSETSGVGKATPLILENNEGERRIFRGWPGHPDPGATFFLKVDPKNGGSSHLVFDTETSRQERPSRPTDIPLRISFRLFCAGL